MCDDLVDRLKASADASERFWGTGYGVKGLAMEAASEVKRLRAEVAALRWLIENGEKHFGSLWREAGSGDIDRVRAALRR